MKGCLIVILLILAVAGGGIWYFFQPKTLIAGYTQEHLDSANSKIGVAFEPLPSDAPTGKTLIVTGSHPVNQTFTSEELTALADNRHKTYAYFPFRNVQIQVHADGSVEGSATVTYRDAVDYLTVMGVSSKDIAQAAAKFKVPNASLPVYLKVSGNVTGNKSNITVESAQIAKITVPEGIVREYTPALNSFIESVIRQRQPSYTIDKLEVAGGQVHFVGSAPDREQAVKSLP